MPGSDFIERARGASEQLQRAREQMPIFNGTETISADSMVTVKLDLLGRPDITIDRSRTYAYEEYQVKMIIIDTYNRAVRAHERQAKDAAGKAAEILQGLANGRVDSHGQQ